MRIGFIEAYQMWAPYEPYLPPLKMMGAGESSFIYLSRELARLGHDVWVNCETEYEGLYQDVYWSKRPIVAELDVAIAGENVTQLEDVEASLKILDCQCNDPFYFDFEYLADLVVARSNWHAWAIGNVVPTLKQDNPKWRTIPNGIDLTQYRDSLPREPYKIIWCSSPDRGLHHALTIFIGILKRIPEAEFHIYYAFEPCFEPVRWGMNQRGEALWQAKRLMETTPNVYYHGGVSRVELIKVQKTAGLLLYPCDTHRWSEGFCVSLMEACAARLPVLTTDCDALGEVYGGVLPMLPLPIYCPDWVDVAVEMLRNPSKSNWNKARALAEVHDWPLIAQKWCEVFNAYLLPEQSRPQTINFAVS